MTKLLDKKISEAIRNLKVITDTTIRKERTLESYFTLGNELKYIRFKADDNNEDQFKILRNKVTNILDCEGLIERQVAESIKSYDRFVLKNLDSIKHPYVGWRINNRETNNFFIDNKDFSNYLKVEIPMEYIGFDHDYEIEYFVNQGYSVLDKSKLEEIKGRI